jgi:hypothetical protein
MKRAQQSSRNRHNSHNDHDQSCPSQPDSRVTSKHLSCVLINSRSVLNKLSELHCLMYTNDFDCVFITETWLSSRDPDGLLDPAHMHNVFRSDRSSRGGGVCIFVAKRHRCYAVNTNTVSQNNSTDVGDGYELCAVDVLFNTKKARFILVYRPPTNGSHGVNAAYRLNRVVNELLFNCICPVYVLGDVNC